MIKVGTINEKAETYHWQLMTASLLVNQQRYRQTLPSLVSLKDELDVGLAFADLDLPFLLSGEEERLTKRAKKEERCRSS